MCYTDRRQIHHKFYHKHYLSHLCCVLLRRFLRHFVRDISDFGHLRERCTTPEEEDTCQSYPLQIW